MNKSINDMTKEELSEELTKVRGERAGKGRMKRREAKTRRITQAGKDRRVKRNVEAEESAEWV